MGFDRDAGWSELLTQLMLFLMEKTLELLYADEESSMVGNAPFLCILSELGPPALMNQKDFVWWASNEVSHGRMTGQVR